MTTEQVSDLIKYFITVAGVVASVWKAFDYLEKKARENSLGAEKVKELHQADTEIRQDIHKMKEHEKTQDSEIEQLERHYDNLINRVWDFFKK